MYKNISGRVARFCSNDKEYDSDYDYKKLSDI